MTKQTQTCYPGLAGGDPTPLEAGSGLYLMMQFMAACNAAAFSFLRVIMGNGNNDSGAWTV